MPWWAQAIIAVLGGGSVIVHLIQLLQKRKERGDAVEDREHVEEVQEESAVIVLLKEQIDDLCARVSKLEGRVEEERRAKHDAIQEVNRLTLENRSLRDELARLNGRVEEMQRVMARIADAPHHEKQAKP